MNLLEVNLPVHNSCYSLLLVTNEMLCHELVHITETLKIVVFIGWILKLISKNKTRKQTDKSQLIGQKFRVLVPKEILHWKFEKGFSDTLEHFLNNLAWLKFTKRVIK